MKTTRTSLKLYKQRFHFSAAHFTIFSKNKRERLHGHNYYLSVDIEVTNKEEMEDYNNIKDTIEDICKRFDERTLIPEKSKHLNISKKENQIDLYFQEEIISLPKNDIILLPIENTTIELISYHLFNLIKKESNLSQRLIRIELSSGPGQSCIQEQIK